MIAMIQCTMGTQEPQTSIMCHASPTPAHLPFRETILHTSQEAANMALLVVVVVVPMTLGHLLHQVHTYIPRCHRDGSPPPRCHRRHSHSPSSESGQQSRMPPACENVPEYMHNHQEHTFKPLTPSARLFHKDPDRLHRHC